MNGWTAVYKGKAVPGETRGRLKEEKVNRGNLPVLSFSDAKRSIQSLKSRQKAGHRAEQLKIKLLKREKNPNCA